MAPALLLVDDVDALDFDLFDHEEEFNGGLDFGGLVASCSTSKSTACACPRPYWPFRK